jgi:DNA-binding LacI/PurR family transcriptional regulator
MAGRSKSTDELVLELFSLTKGSGLLGVEDLSAYPNLLQILADRGHDIAGPAEDLIPILCSTIQRAVTGQSSSDRAIILGVLNVELMGSKVGTLNSRMKDLTAYGSIRTLYRRCDKLIPTLASRLRQLAKSSAPSLAKAEQLTGRKNRVIGVLGPVSHWPTDYYTRILRELRAISERDEGDTHPLLVFDVPRTNIANELVELLSSDGLLKFLAGMISINTVLPLSIREQLTDYGIPVVSINHDDSSPPFVASVLHKHDGFRQLTRDCLIDRRSDCAVLVTKELQNEYKGQIDKSRVDKRDIFLGAAAQAGYAYQGSPISWSDAKDTKLQPGDVVVIETPNYEPTYGSALFSGLKLPPYTLLSFLADSMALSFLASLRSSRSDPEESKIRITGFDNTPESHTHQLSTIDYSLDGVAKAAYQQLRMAIDYPDAIHPVEIVISDRYVARESSTW